MNIIHQGFQVALRVYFPVENLQSMNLMEVVCYKGEVEDVKYTHYYVTTIQRKLYRHW